MFGSKKFPGSLSSYLERGYISEHRSLAAPVRRGCSPPTRPTSKKYIGRIEPSPREGRRGPRPLVVPRTIHPCPVKSVTPRVADVKEGHRHGSSHPSTRTRRLTCYSPTPQVLTERSSVRPTLLVPTERHPRSHPECGSLPSARPTQEPPRLLQACRPVPAPPLPPASAPFRARPCELLPVPRRVSLVH